MKTVKATITVYIEETDNLDGDAQYLRDVIEQRLLDGFMPDETLVEDWKLDIETKG